MLDVGMKKHIGNKLVGPEKVRLEIMKPEQVTMSILKVLSSETVAT